MQILYTREEIQTAYGSIRTIHLHIPIDTRRLLWLLDTMNMGTDVFELLEYNILFSYIIIVLVTNAFYLTNLNLSYELYV